MIKEFADFPSYKSYDLLKICDDYIDTIEMWELNDNELLIRHLDKLFLNKRVQFHWMYENLKKDGDAVQREIVKVVDPMTTIVDGIRFNEKYDRHTNKTNYKIWFDIRNAEIMVNLEYPVKVAITERIYTEEDPYGEEEWEY